MYIQDTPAYTAATLPAVTALNDAMDAALASATRSAVSTWVKANPGKLISIPALYAAVDPKPRSFTTFKRIVKTIPTLFVGRSATGEAVVSFQ